MSKDQVNTWSLVIMALLGLGLLIRAALYFPLALFQIDSDGILAALCAFRIAHGEFPVFFPGGTRLGAASCYAAAAYFHMFGVGRVALAFVGLTWGLLFLVFMLLFLRTVLGERLACLAMVFVAVPSEQFMTVTYVPWAYGEIMASCAATLWLATLWRREGAVWQRVCFGFSIGLGFWFSMETLMVAIPAIAWVALGRRTVMVSESIPALLGLAAGAMPFLVGNVGHGFPSLNQNWASRPTSSIAQALDNLLWLSTYMIPKLLFRSPAWWSKTTVLIGAYVFVAIGFAIMVRKNAVDPRQPYKPRNVGLLLLLVFAACILIFSASEAGTGLGWTVRYIAPLYVVVPLFLALGVESLWHWSKPIAVAVVAALLVPNLLLYGLPGSRQRAELTTELSNELRTCKLLAQHHIQMVYGDYFWVYDLNFDSNERLAGIPSASVVDYLDYGTKLGTSPVRWALLGGRDEVQRLAHGVGARGTLTADGVLWLFIADRAVPNAAKLIAALRKISWSP